MNTVVRKRPKTLIPTQYTRFAFISSLSILRLSICCYYHKEYLLGVLLSWLYITTNLHWNRVYKRSVYWKIDNFMTVSCFLYAGGRAYFYDCASVYYLRTMVHLYVFLLNDFWNKQTIYSPSRMAKMSSIKQHLHYIRMCVVHFLFLHLLQTEAGIYVLSQCKRI